MIIWGSRGKTKIKSAGIFYCPNCRQKRNYILYELGKYFTLYFLPIFQTEKIAEYVECEFCGTKFKPEVLDRSPEAVIMETIYEINKILEKGLPAHVVVKQLIEGGFEEKNANRLVNLALGGSGLKCPNCGVIFSNKINNCSLCGTNLT